MTEERTPNLINDLEKFIYKEHQLRKNQITGDLEKDGNPISPTDFNTIVIDCKRRFLKATTQVIGEIIYSGATPQYNPFKDFFNAAPKEPPRGELDKLIRSIVTDTPHAGLWIKKWMVGLVRSAYEGKHSPLYLILCGGQNSGKTEWFRRLLPNELRSYFAECKFEHGKDDEILMAKKLILLDDEMSGKSKAEEAQLKNRTSKQTITLRLPYDRLDTTLNRVAMLCGTTNETEVLSDPTGNRRFLPINVLSINHALYNSINKESLLHEVFYIYMMGYNPDLTRDDINLLNGSTQRFEVTCLVEETINKCYGLPTGEEYAGVQKLTATEILNEVSRRIPLGYKISLKKIGQVLGKLGFTKATERIGQTVGGFYSVKYLNPSY